MGIDRQELGAAFDADLDTLLGFDCDTLTTPELLASPAQRIVLYGNTQ